MGLSLIAFLNQYELVIVGNALCHWLEIQISRNGGIHYRLNGPLENANLTIKQSQSYLFIFWLDFSRHATAVQFAYRWLVLNKIIFIYKKMSLNREKQVSNKFYLLMLLIPFAFVSLEILALLYDRIQNCHGCEADGELVYIVKYVIFSLLFSDSNNFNQQGTSSMIVGTIFFLTFATITINSIITFTVLCWLKTRKGLMQQNERSRKINRQVSIVLFLQALYPIGLAMIPSILVTIVIVLDMPIPGLLSLMVTQVWNTVVYPMIAILVIGHYRRSLLKMFGLKRRSIVASSETQHPRQTNAVNQVGSSGRMMIAS